MLCPTPRVGADHEHLAAPRADPTDQAQDRDWAVRIRHRGRARGSRAYGRGRSGSGESGRDTAPQDQRGNGGVEGGTGEGWGNRDGGTPGPHPEDRADSPPQVATYSISSEAQADLDEIADYVAGRSAVASA